MKTSVPATETVKFYWCPKRPTPQGGQHWGNFNTNCFQLKEKPRHVNAAISAVGGRRGTSVECKRGPGLAHAAGVRQPGRPRPGIPTCSPWSCHQKRCRARQEERAPSAGQPFLSQLGFRSDPLAADGGLPNVSVVREVLSKKRGV